MSHGSWERRNLQWPSLRRSPQRVGANRMLLERRSPEEAHAWSHAQDRLTSGRCAARESGESEATSQNAGSQEPDGGLARDPMDQGSSAVFRLQKRMYQATQRGDVRTVRQLQNLLSKSWYARLLAVRRVTQDNRGRHTAGIDGVKSLQPPQRLRLANELTLDDTATPLRRMWRPKRGTPEQRPLGVPTLHERA